MDSSIRRDMGSFKGLQETPCSGKARNDLKVNPTRALFLSATSMDGTNTANTLAATTTCTLKQQQILKNQSELSPDSRELFDDLEEAEIAHQPRPSLHIPDSSARSIATPALVRAQLDRAQSVVSSFRGAIPDSAAVVPNTNHNATATLAVGSGASSSAVRPTPNQRLAFSAVRQPPQHMEGSNEMKTETSTESPMQETERREKSAEELLAESERLAMQLMQEEETLLCERIQQEQMRVIAEMRRSRRSSDGNQAESNDLDVALRLAEQEDGEGQEIDVDEMSYDELLELGEDIGDVKQERWRIEGRAVVSSLRVVTYEGKGSTQGDLPAAIVQDEDPKCVVCQYSYVEKDRLKVLPCGHAFHEECIDTWLRDHDTCVTCKRSIKEEEAKEEAKE